MIVAGVRTVMDVGDTTVTLVPASVPNFTEAGLMKPVPVMVTSSPPTVEPDEGDTSVTVGRVASYVKSSSVPVVLLELPTVVVTCTSTVSATADAGVRIVMLVGDSTTAGMCEGCPPSPGASPAGALEALRTRLPEGSRWRRLRAVSAGVGGSTTADWLDVNPQACRFLERAGSRGRDPGSDRSSARASAPTPVPVDLGLRALASACASGGGLGASVRRLLGEPPALVLLVLGANDVMNRVSPETYVANVRAIAAEFAPAKVLVATPFWSPQPERVGLAAYAEALRRAGLVAGPDFHAIRLPVDRLGVHLTPGGYAASGALWLDRLPP